MGIYFIRHLMTQNNKSNILSGRSNVGILPDQEIIFSPTLELSTVFSSPAKRCRQTIRALSLEFSIAKHAIFDERLEERNLGFLEGMSRKDAIARYPHLFCDNKLNVTASIPNGESISDVINRIKSFMSDQDLCSISESSNVLICSHNQTLKLFLAYLSGIEIDNTYWHRVNFPFGKVVDASYFEL